VGRALVLRRARCLDGEEWSEPRDVLVEGGLVRSGAEGTRAADEVDLEGRALLPALVNAHDVLDLSTLPALGAPPHGSVYEWAYAAEKAEGGLAEALRVPLVDRLFLGGMRNLLAGVSAVLHHHPYHRSVGRKGFPVRVQHRYGFAHSPVLTPRLRATYRTTDRRIPWLVRVAEGRDVSLRREIDVLAEANVLRPNTVLVHGTALAPEDGARLAAAQASLVWCPEADRRLYGLTAPVAALRAAGVRLGLGSDSAAAGSRDALSNLAAARREGIFGDRDLLELATCGAADVARLPCGGFSAGAPADLLAAGSTDGLLAGDRRAVSLVVVGGAVVYGEASLLEGVEATFESITVDGAPRALRTPLARRMGALFRRHPMARHARWAADVDVPRTGAVADRVL
jgi:cytosine/adenosine deaminase-related metal-dependent hydrolase